jgi:hypothetical protein
VIATGHFVFVFVPGEQCAAFMLTYFSFFYLHVQCKSVSTSYLICDGILCNSSNSTLCFLIQYDGEDQDVHVNVS